MPGHGPVSVQHSHEHTNGDGGTHVHTHRHRADARHEPGRDHLHPALPDGPPGVAAGGPLAAGIAAARAAQLAADPLGPAGLSDDEVYERLFGG